MIVHSFEDLGPMFRDLVVGRMRELGITKRELASRMGVTEQFVGQLLNRDTDLRTKTIAAVFRALDCRVSLVVEPNDERVPA